MEFQPFAGGAPGMPPMPIPMPMPGMQMPMPVMPMPMDPSQPMDTTQRAVENLAPNCTVYVHNLNEKVNKEELKKSLYHVFSPHGKILEIHAQKLYKLRGQAWIIYEAEADAVKAVQSMAGYSFYGKPMRVNFSRVKSDVVSKKDGTFVPRPKRKTKGDSKKSKKVKTSTKSDSKASKPLSSSVALGSTLAMANFELGPVPPNNILFIENLPTQCTVGMLEMLFQQYEGFQEARMVQGKPGIAFIEFTGVAQAAQAKDNLHNFSITPTNQMKITFAKK